MKTKSTHAKGVVRIPHVWRGLVLAYLGITLGLMSTKTFGQSTHESNAFNKNGGSFGNNGPHGDPGSGTPPTPEGFETMQVAFEIMSEGKQLKNSCAVCHWLEVKIDGKNYKTGEVVTLPKGTAFDITVDDILKPLPPNTQIPKENPRNYTGNFTVYPIPVDGQTIKEIPGEANEPPKAFIAKKDEVFQYLIENSEGLLVRDKQWPKDDADSPIKKKALIVPLEIAVDANRDGVITMQSGSNSSKPIDKTSSEKPFRFWVNDDDDYSVGMAGAETGEHVPVQRSDWNDAGGVSVIDGKRDLEDFSLLSIYLGGLQDAIAAGTIKVGLKWKNTNGTQPSINVYRSAAVDGSDSYLKTEVGATAQMQDGFAAAKIKVEGTTAAVFPSDADIWTGLSAAAPSKYFLFEGATEGKGQLCITIYDADGNEIGEGPGVWLDIKNIKKMYQRVDSATAHPWENMAFEADPNEDRKEAVIFVHGWRMSPEGAGNFAETMYKRMWHRGFKGRFVAFHWDTWWHDGFSWVPWAGEAIDAYLARYNDSEKIAWQAGTALKTFVDNLSFDRKNIVAHSMGNIVAGQALVEGMAIQNYALLQAAVPSACYDDDETRIKQTSQYHHQAGVLFFNIWDSPTPDADVDPATKNLAYRGTFQNVAGNLINFYLPDDQATSFAWEINNDQTKPPLYQGENSNASLCFNYEYDPNGQPGEKLIRFELSALYPSYYVTSKPEAMSYACRTWGKAVGAWGTTDGSLNGSPVNLKDPEFGGPRGFDTEHSAEFSRRIQQLKPFYDRLLDKLQVKRNP